MSAVASPWSLMRLRQSAHLRDLSNETTFGMSHLVQPLFVVEDRAAAGPIAGLAGNERHDVDGLLTRIELDLEAGVRQFLLFGVPSERSGEPSTFAITRDAVAAIKARFGGALHLWADVCLCSWTSHGHCAVLDASGAIDLTRTIAALQKQAVELAEAGVDGVSPSDMMDGRTAALRRALDESGRPRVAIMSYSTKFASAFYGPFREAAGSAPAFGDRRAYQIDVRARADAIASSVRCAGEGADLLMVKPGMTSIDLIAPIRERTGRLAGAYQVSGEYAGLVSLAAMGYGDIDAMLLETWHVFRRAGASFVITYGARRGRALGMGA